MPPRRRSRPSAWPRRSWRTTRLGRPVRASWSAVAGAGEPVSAAAPSWTPITWVRTPSASSTGESEIRLRPPRRRRRCLSSTTGDSPSRTPASSSPSSMEPVSAHWSIRQLPPAISSRGRPVRSLKASLAHTSGSIGRRASAMHTPVPAASSARTASGASNPPGRESGSEPGGSGRKLGQASGDLAGRWASSSVRGRLHLPPPGDLAGLLRVPSCGGRAAAGGDRPHRGIDGDFVALIAADQQAVAGVRGPDRDADAAGVGLGRRSGGGCCWPRRCRRWCSSTGAATTTSRPTQRSRPAAQAHWQRFFRDIGLNGNVGIWHETYTVATATTRPSTRTCPRPGWRRMRGLGSSSTSRERIAR